MIDAYFEHAKKGLHSIVQSESKKMEAAAQKIAQAVMTDHMIHVFGCGHSHMAAEEVFYRAGGLATVNPILVESLMLHEGAVNSSEREKEADFGKSILKEYNISTNDIFIVVSTSGRNPVPIDVALSANKLGCFVIGITSFNYAGVSSRHESGKRLEDVVHLAINNHVQKGDAILTHRSVKVPFSPISTIHNTAIINAIFAQGINLIANNNSEPPVFLSGNIDNANEHNDQLINTYKHKVPLLKVGSTRQRMDECKK